MTTIVVAALPAVLERLARALPEGVVPVALGESDAGVRALERALSAAAALVLVTDGMRRADVASLEGLLQGWGGGKVVVRGRRWRGFGALPLARVCDGVVAGFEDVGLLVPVVVRWLRGQVVPSARQA